MRRTAALAALAALSALALTACGPSEDGAAGGATTPPAKPATPTAPPTKPTPTAPPAKPTPATPTTPTTPTKPATPPAKPTPDPDADVFPCSTFDVTFSAVLAEPTTSSYLLKITNRTGKPCRVLGHPVVTFGELDGAATERGKAPAVEHALRLAPGQSAYAGLMGGPLTAQSTTVPYIRMTMNTESDLEQVPLKAATPGLHVTPDKESVTPWVDNAEDALSL
ncbi:DUF4232 domain-containing protein [Streptomyces roseoviridis]|uniref:DUF4232 domain-containing protein n=1 Tax=Streptomyces roseoviridis TaxID=67361 RepID=A0ABV5QJ77_9ACTN